jgi:hypothetical protein
MCAARNSSSTKWASVSTLEEDWTVWALRRSALDAGRLGARWCYVSSVRGARTAPKTSGM